jgi:hypothetical protein
MLYEARIIKMGRFSKKIKLKTVKTLPIEEKNNMKPQTKWS